MVVAGISAIQITSMKGYIGVLLIIGVLGNLSV